jgi:hypothetical protein
MGPTVYPEAGAGLKAKRRGETRAGGGALHERGILR